MNYAIGLFLICVLVWMIIHASWSLDERIAAHTGYIAALCHSSDDPPDFCASRVAEYHKIVGEE